MRGRSDRWKLELLETVLLDSHTQGKAGQGRAMCSSRGEAYIDYDI